MQAILSLLPSPEKLISSLNTPRPMFKSKLASAKSPYNIAFIIPERIPELQTAVTQGSAEAQHQLALCYLYGMGGLEFNYDEACKLLVASALQGNIRAMYNIGHWLYLLGVEESNPDKASLGMELVREAANSGFSGAEYFLYVVFCHRKIHGKYVPWLNEEKAIQFLKDAEINGFSPAITAYDDMVKFGLPTK